MLFKPLVFVKNLQFYTAVGDTKLLVNLEFFSLTFYVKCVVSAPYYAVLLFKFDLTKNMVYSNVYSFYF